MELSAGGFLGSDDDKPGGAGDAISVARAKYGPHSPCFPILQRSLVANVVIPLLRKLSNSNTASIERCEFNSSLELDRRV